MLHALQVNFENLGHTTKNKIFRLVKLLADLVIGLTRENCHGVTVAHNSPYSLFTTLA